MGFIQRKPITDYAFRTCYGYAGRLSDSPSRVLPVRNPKLLACSVIHTSPQQVDDVVHLALSVGAHQRIFTQGLYLNAQHGLLKLEPGAL